MEFQISNKNFRFNVNKNIGKVLYIVEGEKRELNLLYRIFKYVLNYDEVFTINRDKKPMYTLKSKINPNSKVAIINTSMSNIKSINDTNFIEDQLKLIQGFDIDFDIDNCAIYYIFDADRLEDTKTIEEYVEYFTNSREPNAENSFNRLGGMLLLSYPSIESFVISNFESDLKSFFENNKDDKFKIKEYINSKKYNDNKIKIDTLYNALKEMINSLLNANINDVNLDDLSKLNKELYEYEKLNDFKYIISLLLISFLDLGIFEEDA